MTVGEQYLANFIETTSKVYGVAISAENTKLMPNNCNGIHKSRQVAISNDNGNDMLYRRLLNITHIANEAICYKIQAAIGSYEDLLSTCMDMRYRMKYPL